MESSLLQRSQTGNLHCRRRAGQAGAGDPHAQQNCTRKDRLAHKVDRSSGRLASRLATLHRKIEPLFNHSDNKEEFNIEEPNRRFQNGRKSCPKNYPVKKIACLR